MNRKDLERYLRSHGCEWLRHGSKHDHWWNPSTGVVVSVPRHRTVKRPTVRGLCRGLGIPAPPGL